MSKAKLIKVRERFWGVADTDIVARGTAVLTALTGNTNFPSVPVDLAALRLALDTFAASIAQAADGSKKVIADKSRQRKTVIEMLRLLGRYVEIESKNDLAILQTSGFQAISTTRAPAQPLSEKIRKIEHGPNRGQVVVWLLSVRGAVSYQIRYAPSVNGATPTTWNEKLVAQVKAPAVLTGLTPGTTYAFQARAALKNSMYTDWTDSLTFICT
jgi:hypothetical protein